MIGTALSGAKLREAPGGEKRRMLHLYVDRLRAASRAIPRNVQERKEQGTNLHVRIPQHERLHALTCRAVRCLTDSDKLIPWPSGEQPPEKSFDDEAGRAISDKSLVFLSQSAS